MKKEDFIKLGLDEDVAKKCEELFVEELRGFIPKARFDEVNNERKRFELELQERDGQLEALKKTTGDVADMKKTIETLQADNVAKDEAYAAQVKRLKVDTVVVAALNAAKAKNITAVKALLKLDLDTVELDENERVKGLDEALAKLKTAEDSSFLFDTETTITKMKGVAPGETGKEAPDTKVDFSNMTYEELAAHLVDNPDAAV